MQPVVQIADPLDNVLHLVLVFRLDLASLADCNVQGHPNGALGTGQPATCRGIGVGHEADAMLAGIGSREGEAAGVIITFVHNAMVIVEGLFDGDLHLEVVVDRVGVGLGVDDLGLKSACSGNPELVNMFTQKYHS